MLKEKPDLELEIGHLMQQALAEQKRFQEQLEEAQRKLKEIGDELSAYERTLNAYRRRQGKPVPKAVRLSDTTLQQLSVADGMETLLREQGGIGKIAMLARRLFEAGKLKNKRTANSHVRGVMYRDHRFVFLGDATVGLAREVGTDKESAR